MSRFSRIAVHDLKGEAARVQAASAQESKCGTCQSFEVRPNEVFIAQIARPMGACGPGSYCFGGPVRGWCSHWNKQMDSTAVCDAYQAGGPNAKALSMGAVGSANKHDKSNPLIEFGLTGGVALLVLGAAVAHDAWKDK